MSESRGGKWADRALWLAGAATSAVIIHKAREKVVERIDDYRERKLEAVIDMARDALYAGGFWVSEPLPNTVVSLRNKTRAHHLLVAGPVSDDPFDVYTHMKLLEDANQILVPLLGESDRVNLPEHGIFSNAGIAIRPGVLHYTAASNRGVFVHVVVGEPWGRKLMKDLSESGIKSFEHGTLELSALLSQPFTRGQLRALNDQPMQA